MQLVRKFHPSRRSSNSRRKMPQKTTATPAIQAITAPTELTQPPTRAGPPEPSNPDNPWGLKNTFRWLVSLLRSHNALLDSHIELQRTVTDLRQNILELARLPITAPIWCDQGFEAVIQPQDEPLFPNPHTAQSKQNRKKQKTHHRTKDPWSLKHGQMTPSDKH